MQMATERSPLTILHGMALIDVIFHGRMIGTHIHPLETLTDEEKKSKTRQEHLGQIF